MERPGDLRILLAYDDANTLRGIAPLRRQTIRKYGQNVLRPFRFIGDGSNDSDYLDFIIARRRRGGGDGGFLQASGNRNWRAGTLLQLNEIPDSSPNLAFLRALGATRRHDLRAKRIRRAPPSRCRTPGTSTWANWLRASAPRFAPCCAISKRAPTCSSSSATARARSTACCRRSIDLHQPPMGRRSQTGRLSWDQKRVFYRDAFAAAAGARAAALFLAGVERADSRLPVRIRLPATSIPSFRKATIPTASI